MCHCCVMMCVSYVLLLRNDVCCWLLCSDVYCCCVVMCVTAEK
jgi:hypothetical protein